jgi:hypothetical protein
MLRHAARPLPFLMALLAFAGCKSDDGGLFDEERGTFVLVAYTLPQSAQAQVLGSCTSAFLVGFDAANGVAAAATDGRASGVGDSFCQDQAEPVWSCRCFDYEWTSTGMIWTERGGDGDGDGDGDGGTGGTGDVAGDGTTNILMTADENVNDRWRFQPLPLGLFSSDEDLASYEFEIKAASIFEATGCMDVCLGGA